MRKLSLKVVGGRAWCGSCGGRRDGARGGSKALDDSPYFKYSDLIHFGGRFPLKDIGNQKQTPCPKFTQDMQAKAL